MRERPTIQQQGEAKDNSTFIQVAGNYYTLQIKDLLITQKTVKAPLKNIPFIGTMDIPLKWPILGMIFISVLSNLAAFPLYDYLLFLLRTKYTNSLEMLYRLCNSLDINFFDDLSLYFILTLCIAPMVIFTIGTMVYFRTSPRYKIQYKNNAIVVANKIHKFKDIQTMTCQNNILFTNGTLIFSNPNIESYPQTILSLRRRDIAEHIYDLYSQYRERQSINKKSTNY